MGMTNFDGLAFQAGLYVGKSGEEVQLINSSGAFVNPVSFTKNLTIGDAATDTLTVNATSSFLAPASHSAQILANSGSLALPGYSFKLSGSGNTGFWLSGADAIGFVSNGIARGGLASTGIWTLGSAASTVTHVVEGAMNLSKNMGIGGALSALAVVNIGATNPLSATNQVAALASFASTSGATASTRGFSSLISTSAAAYTSTFVNCFEGEITAGAGSTITRAVMFDATRGMTATGTISNRATIADNQAFTGSFFIHSSSSNPSVLSGYLQIQNQADPGAITDGVRIGSVDLSAGNATLSLRTERAVATESVASDRTLSVQINGTTYKILLAA